MNREDRKKWMFKKVKCDAFMKKVRDGKCIMHYAPSESQDGKEHWCYYDTNDPDGETEVPEDERGGSDFIKTYYERRKKKFVGVVVGGEKIVAKARLFVDVGCDYDGRVYEYIDKWPSEEVECLRVFYGCNKSRYVPISDITMVEESEGEE